MPAGKSPEDLSVSELRWLLVQKRRHARQDRLERYRRTGRVVTVVSDFENPDLDRCHSNATEDQLDSSTRRSSGRRILDGFLLVVEISAVLGFIFILFNGLSLMRELNREVIAVLEQPTLTPTPLIGAVVLPSGHTPPDSPGGARFNEAEIPEHLLPLVQSQINVPLPTSGPEQATRIQIPALKVKRAECFDIARQGNNPSICTCPLHLGYRPIRRISLSDSPHIDTPFPRAEER